MQVITASLACIMGQDGAITEATTSAVTYDLSVVFRRINTQRMKH